MEKFTGRESDTESKKLAGLTLNGCLLEKLGLGKKFQGLSLGKIETEKFSGPPLKECLLEKLGLGKILGLGLGKIRKSWDL